MAMDAVTLLFCEALRSVAAHPASRQHPVMKKVIITPVQLRTASACFAWTGKLLSGGPEACQAVELGKA